MAGPLISVLIRSMGRPLLQQALDSIARQDYPEIEVCVIAASGSAHPPLLAHCGPFPLRLFGNGQRLPRADAANFGLDSAQGDYCIFLDDDDYHDPDHVSGLLAALRANPVARVAYSGIRVIGNDGSPRGVIFSAWDRLALHQRNYIQIGAALFERSLAGEGCRFDPAVGSYDDWDFWLQCATRTDFAWRNKPTTSWRSEAGESGAGGGPNFDPAVNEASLAAVQGKWAAERARLGRDLAAWTDRAAVAQQRGNYDTAERCCHEALRIRGTDPDLLHQLGTLAYARQDVAAALAALRLALRGHPGRSDIACSVARIELETGNLTAGRKLLEILLRREPGNAEARALLARYQF